MLGAMNPGFLPFVERWFSGAFDAATRPQREGWDAIARGDDTLIVAPTGSGKTLAAFLWGVDHLHRLALEGKLYDRVYLVYVSPLRALNNDIEKNLRGPLAGLRAAAAEDGLELPEVRVAVRTSDTLAAARQAMTRRPPHVLITTPESLYILLTSRRFRPALAGVRFVIVDEIHALMGSKRGAHLAVTLERLQALVEAERGERPQRIGCSATVSPVESALAYLTGSTVARTTIVDAGFTRDLDLKVVAPVDDFLESNSDTVWDATLQQVAEMVEGHRTTLVFAQSRRSAERLARDLNDRLGEGRVAAHHGSLSRRARLDAENRLKDGELRALVATSSLELGIDVGVLDLVVQLQSPRNVAAALQRVGRAGHMLSRVSKGRIVVTKGDELIEAAAVVRAIRARALDRVASPDQPLDVLAQQIVASVAAESLGVDELLERIRRAAPYRGLSREDFVLVLRSLADPLPREVKGVGPRILWDRVNDRLHSRRGSRFLALTSGGTIPDAGLYDVYVAETDLKVGTLDEEFVTETLPGSVFLLGSHAWRLIKLQADRVLVEDAQGMSPTIPFWKGEHPSRSYELGLGVARLRREAASRLAEPGFDEWAAETCGLDARAASAMRAWLTKADEVLGGVPDEDEIVVESFADEMGGRHAMIHSAFGMRVNGAWGMALRLAVRRRFGLQAETSHVDDGILLSFAPGQVPPPPERLVKLVAPEDVDNLLGHALIGSPLFTTRFRHCAIRALFIARMWNGKRTPPYLQRLKADALMESVGGLAEFPVVAETLRECFYDALDVHRVKRLLERLHDGEVRTRHVDTPVPSPFVYPLLLAWDWAYLDAGHAEERRSDAVPMRKAWSAPAGPLDPLTIAAVEADLQKTARDRRARDANELAALLDELGDLTEEEIAARVATDDPGALIEALRAEGRIVDVSFPGGHRAWMDATDLETFKSLASGAALERVILRFLRTHGPVGADLLSRRYGLAVDGVTMVLDALTDRGMLRRDAFLAAVPGPLYVHVAVLDEIQRRQLRARRVPRGVATPVQFSAFLLRRHHIHPDHRLVGPPGVLASLELLQGEDLPVRAWEHDILGARVEGFEREWVDRLGLSGEVVWTTFAATATRVGVALRENLGWLRETAPALPELETRSKNVLLHLQLRGASFARELGRVTGYTADETHAALWELFRAGLAAPDTYSAVVAGQAKAPDVPAAPGKPARRPFRRGQARGPRGALPVVGRWSALGGDEQLSPEDRAEARAHLLLARYGVVSRELAHGEWSTLRHALLRMEYGGEVVRGYFVEGLSGEQYALEDALEDLAAPPRRGRSHCVVGVADPANLWGRVFTLSAAHGTRLSLPRGAGWLIVRDGAPVALVENHGRDVRTLAAWQPSDLAGLIEALNGVLERPAGTRPVRHIAVATWDGEPVTQSAMYAPLRAAGLA
jgi:ATP-dependent Lhr-like helicase